MITIVYICIGTQKKEYINMLKISVASARLYMPTVPISVLTDEATAEQLSELDIVTKYKVKIIPAEIPGHYSTVEKSRYLKTNMRRLIRGDMLYVDCDTIFCEDISDTAVKHPVNMVLDAHCLLAEQEYEAAIHRAAQQRGIDLDGCTHYYNSGVILSADNEKAAAFFDEWYHLWDETRRDKMHHDQFSLNAVNTELNAVSELDGTWNCQLTANDRAFHYHRGVKILHYLSAQPHGIYRLNDIDFLRSDISDADLDDIIRHPERQFRPFHFYADDSPEYRIMQHSHFALLHRLYDRHPKLYRLADRSLSLFRK